MPGVLMKSISLFTVCALMTLMLGACEPGSTGSSGHATPHIFDKGDRLGLTFEDRMAVRARLTVITAEAQAEANAIYDKYRSRELAVRNERYADELEKEKVDELKAAHNLTDADLDSIIEEYLYHQRVNIRQP